MKDGRSERSGGKAVVRSEVMRGGPVKRMPQEFKKKTLRDGRTKK